MVNAADWSMLNCFAGRSDRHGTAIIYHNALFWVHSSIHLLETLKDRLDVGERISHRTTCISTQKPKCGKMAFCVTHSSLPEKNIFMKIDI